VSVDLTTRRERLAALVRTRRPATQAVWLALADEDEWAELDEGQRARVVELVVVEEQPLVETKDAG
jgi:hypothetical protein